MIKNILYINITNHKLTELQDLRSSDYVIPFTSEAFVDSVEDTLAEIKDFNIHTLNFNPLMTDTKYIHSIKRVIDALQFEFIIFNLDESIRIFSDPLLHPGSDFFTIDKWLEIFSSISGKKRRKSLILFNESIIALNAVYFLLKELRYHYDKNNSIPINIEFPSSQRLKRWGQIIGHFISYEKKEVLKILEIEEVRNDSAIYINYGNISDREIDNRFYLFSQMYNIFEKGTKKCNVFIENRSCHPKDLQIEELSLSFLDAELGVTIYNSPRLLELLYDVMQGNYSNVYIYSLDDFSIDIHEQNKIVSFLNQHNIKIYELEGEF